MNLQNAQSISHVCWLLDLTFRKAISSAMRAGAGYAMHRGHHQFRPKTTSDILCTFTRKEAQRSKTQRS